MRLLEQHNPDVSFDWERLLKSGSSASPGSVGSGSGSRDERRRDRRDQRRPRDSEPRVPAVASAPTPQVPEDRAGSDFRGISSEPAAADAFDGAVPSPRFGEPDAEPEPGEAEPGTPNPENLKNREPEDAVEPDEPVPPEPLDERYLRLGADGLRRLRARYADLKGRIAAKPMDEAQRNELTARLERLNPDAWLTDEDVARGIDEYELVFESFRGVVGRPPRRSRL